MVFVEENTFTPDLAKEPFTSLATHNMDNTTGGGELNKTVLEWCASMIAHQVMSTTNTMWENTAGMDTVSLVAHQANMGTELCVSMIAHHAMDTASRLDVSMVAHQV